MFSKNDYNHQKLTIAIIFSGLATAFSAASLFYAIYNIESKNEISESVVFSALEKMEAYKVGGIDNWNSVKSIYEHENYKQRQTDELANALSMLNNNTAEIGGNTATVAANSELSANQIALLTDNIPLQGNKDSDIVLLEYSDFECPFCQRMFDAGTIKSLIESENIAAGFKQFPLHQIHPGAQKLAEGSLCALEIAGEKGFFEYINKIFTTGNGAIDHIYDIAKDLNLDATKFADCLDNGKYEEQVYSEQEQGATLFGIGGTPATVIINKKTGKFQIVEGAVNLYAFKQAVQAVRENTEKAE